MRWDGPLETDEALLALVAARRNDAFEELYRRHAPAVNAVLWRGTGDRAMTAELVQTTFLRLWERAATISTGNLHLRAWLLTVARNALVDRQRRARTHVVPLEVAADLVEPSRTEDDAMNELARRDVRQALAMLPEEQRTTIELAFFGGLTQVEIAVALDTPLGTIKGRVRLGMKKLRELLAPIEGEPA